MPEAEYPRDMVGYGASVPDAHWPDDARVAINFVVNYEEGGENNILHGDQASEAFLSEIIGAEPWPGRRHMNMESIYEYGSRAGFWRLYRMFTERQLPVTVFGVATALERNPRAVQAMLRANWEIATHGLKWIDYGGATKVEERRHLQEAVDIHKRLTGSRPFGLYQGRTSAHTRDLSRELGFEYSADSYADDLPYYEDGLLIVPYTLDANDMRFATAQGFNSGEQFERYLRDSLEVLRHEGNRMMSVGLHCRLVGRPGRAASLGRFLDHVKQLDDVWVATRIDIARHWRTWHPE